MPLQLQVLQVYIESGAGISVCFKDLTYEYSQGKRTLK